MAGRRERGRKKAEWVGKAWSCHGNWELSAIGLFHSPPHPFPVLPSLHHFVPPSLLRLHPSLRRCPRSTFLPAVYLGHALLSSHLTLSSLHLPSSPSHFQPSQLGLKSKLCLIPRRRRSWRIRTRRNLSGLGHEGKDSHHFTRPAPPAPAHLFQFSLFQLEILP